MSDIPGIDPDKVQRYGKRFLKILQTSQERYEDMMQKQEDRPQDPNHENVIIISSEDEFGEDGGIDDFEEENGSQEERSSYFPEVPPEVDAFNAQCRSSGHLPAAPSF